MLLAMSVCFGLLLLLSRASHRRRGLSMGATLVFLLSLIATALANPTEGVSFLIAGITSIPLVLLWSRIWRFFFDGPPTLRTNDIPAAPYFPNPARPVIPISQGQTTANLNPGPIRLEEPVAPFSVTEDPTALFEQKLPRKPS
jgi:hypothetical protein